MQPGSRVFCFELFRPDRLKAESHIFRLDQRFIAGDGEGGGFEKPDSGPLDRFDSPDSQPDKQILKRGPIAEECLSECFIGDFQPAGGSIGESTPEFIPAEIDLRLLSPLGWSLSGRYPFPQEESQEKEKRD